jgi:hypothetical protein
LLGGWKGAQAKACATKEKRQPLAAVSWISP